MGITNNVRFKILVAAATVAPLFLTAGCGSGTLSKTSSNAGSPGTSGLSGVHHSAHVILVIEENHSFSQVMSSMPWLTSMGSTYAYADDYHADTPGSLLDYLWLSSGSGELKFGCTGSNCTAPIMDDNIFRELDKANVSWKLYAESLPSAGYMGGNSGKYTDRHNPAKWYSDVISSTSDQQKMVPFTQFATDVSNNQLPAYSIIIPNVMDDAHDGTLQQADTFLSTQVAAVLDQPYFKPGGDGLLIVTFDECDAALGACPEQVYTALMGPHVKRNFVSGLPYKHENMLRTIMDALGVSVYPGASATADDMSDFFQ